MDVPPHERRVGGKGKQGPRLDRPKNLRHVAAPYGAAIKKLARQETPNSVKRKKENNEGS